MLIGRRELLFALGWLSLMPCDFAGAEPPKPATAPEVKPGSDPEQVKIVTTDVSQFWEAFARALPQNRLLVFEKDYVSRGSIGLKDYMEQRTIDLSALVGAIDTHRDYYTAIRENSLQAIALQEPLRESLRKFKALYPDASFPDIYFIIGNLQSRGSLTKTGLMIAVEVFSMGPNIPTSEFEDPDKLYLHPIVDLHGNVMQQIVRYQQFSIGLLTTVLAESLLEGSANFLSELVIGKPFKEALYTYGNAHERELWLQFKQDMSTNKFNQWLFNRETVVGKPAELGAYMGYRITQAYYNRSPDKKQAIKEIVTVRDFNRLLNESHYGDQFS
jgi:hypothetical protein